MPLRRLAKINERLKTLKTLIQEVGVAEVIIIRQKELLERVSVFERPVSQCIVLKRNQWLPQEKIPADLVDKVQASLQKIREALSKDPGAIKNPMESLLKNVDTLGEALGKLAADRWKEVVESSKPSVVEADLVRLEQDPSEKKVVSEIRALSRQRNLTPPQTEEDLTRIQQDWVSLGELIRNLPQMSDNPEVNRFLDAVRQDGASLELFTEAVREYLVVNKRLGLYRIYLRRR